MNQEVENIEVTIEQARAQIALGEALKRLEKNPDFQKVILDDYLRDEAIRLVHAKSDANLQTAQRQEAIIRDIDAIGSLRQYFLMVQHGAESAEAAIEDANEQLAEIHSQDTDGDS